MPTCTTTNRGYSFDPEPNSLNISPDLYHYVQSATARTMRRIAADSAIAGAVHSAMDARNRAPLCSICGEQHPTNELVNVSTANRLAGVASAACAHNEGYYQLDPRYRGHREAEYQHPENTITAQDTGHTCTHYFAEMYWNFSESDGAYYQHRRNMPDYEGGDTHEYSTDVLEIYGWPEVTPHDSLCMGVELEIEARERQHELAAKLGGCGGDGATYILKSDGSLYDGVELVTLPYTLDFHHKHFNWKEKLNGVGLVGTSGSRRGPKTCGIHVHVNRAAMSPLTLGKVLVFMNSPINQDQITTIAQRNPSRWAEFKTKKLTDGKHNSRVRYEAVNVTNSTAEFRIFRGNLRPERILKNLEFCHAVVQFCKVASLTNLTWDAFWQFVIRTDNRHQYRNLINFVINPTNPDNEEA